MTTLFDILKPSSTARSSLRHRLEGDIFRDFIQSQIMLETEATQIYMYEGGEEITLFNVDCLLYIISIFIPFLDFHSFILCRNSRPRPII